MRLTLTRHAATPWATLGVLMLENGASFATLEPPWRLNMKGRSCIPLGSYRLERVPSPLVRRLTANAMRHAWHVVGVDNRSSILIHPGNFPGDTQGCILPGDRHAILKGQLAVLNSKVAFDAIMSALDPAEPHLLSIEWAHRQPHPREG